MPTSKIFSNIQLGECFGEKPCRVFDVLKKEIIATYPSRTACAKALGIHQALVSNIIRNKRRNKSNILGITVTIR